jgi:hypothetical protein
MSEANAERNGYRSYSAGICIKFKPDLLDPIYDTYKAAVKDIPAPDWLDGIEDTAHRYSVLQAPRTEADDYSHFDISEVLVIDHLLMGLKPHPRLNPVSSISRKSARSLRRYGAVYSSLMAGNPDYVVSTHYCPES